MSKLNDLLNSMISSLNQKSSDGHLHATSDLSDIGAFETKITEESQFFSMLSLGNFPIGYLNSEGYLFPIPGQKMPVPSEFGLPTVQSGMADVTGYELVALLWRLYTMQQAAYIPFVVIDDISVDTDTIPLIIVASRMLEGSEEVLPLEVNASMHTCKTLIPGEVYSLAIMFDETTEQFDAQIIGADYRFDTEPTENSPNLLSSGDIYNALQKIGTATGNVTKLSQLEEDTNHRLVTDTEKSAWNSKADGNHKHATTDLSDIDDFNQNLATTYAKKTELPTIPTKVSAFENDKGYLTEHQSLEGYAKTTDIPTVPTNVSAFENDKGYLTEHQSLEEYAKRDELPVVPTNVSAFTNDKGYLTEESDPTVPAWAKEPNRPTYTAEDVGAEAKGTAETLISTHNTGTDAHNDIRLLIQGLIARLDAVANSTDDELDQLSEIVAYIKNNKGLIDSITTSKVGVADIIDNLTTNVSNKPLSAAQGVVLKAFIDAITVPTKVSQLENDKGYLTQHQDLSAYAKKTDIPTVPTALSQLSQDSTHRVVTDTEKSTWNAKSNLAASNKGYNGAITASTDGVAEMGKYIDFHATSNGTSDYSTRFVCTGDHKNSVNLPSAAGTLVVGDRALLVKITSSAPSTNDTSIITIVV